MDYCIPLCWDLSWVLLVVLLSFTVSPWTHSTIW